jgi:lysophospholipase L1-like esterase
MNRVRIARVTRAAALLIAGFVAGMEARWLAAEAARLRRLPPLGAVHRALAGNTAAIPAPNPRQPQAPASRRPPQRVGPVLLGDSITSRWLTDGRAEWGRLFAPADAVNLGVGEDRVENLLWRLRHGEMDGLATDRVLLLIGTNNLGLNTPGEIGAGAGLVLDEAGRRAPGATIDVLAILPRGDLPPAVVRAANAAVRREAERRACRWIDATSALAAPDGWADRRLVPDGVHLSGEGYARLGAAIARGGGPVH